MKNIIGTLFLLVTLLLFVSIGYGIGYRYISAPLVSSLKRSNEMQEMYRHELARANETLTNITLEQERTERLYTTALDRIELIITLRDSGLTSALTIENIRDLLELTDQIPYGSPFASGHWISSKFGLRDESQIRGNNYTEGIDLVGKSRDNVVRTTADGIITDFGYSDTYGKFIVVDHQNGYRTTYSHLAKIFYQDLDKGTVKDVPLKKGDKIGIMGNTGLTFSENGGDGTHLDYRLAIYDESTDVWLNLNPTAIIAYTGGQLK